MKPVKLTPSFDITKPRRKLPDIVTYPDNLKPISDLLIETAKYIQERERTKQVEIIAKSKLEIAKMELVARLEELEVKRMAIERDYIIKKAKIENTRLKLSILNEIINAYLNTINFFMTKLEKETDMDILDRLSEAQHRLLELARFVAEIDKH